MSGWKTVSKNFFSLTTAEAFNRFAGLIYLPYIARIFGPEGFGKVSFAESIVTYFMFGANFGIDMIGIREIAKLAGAGVGTIHLYLHKFGIKPNNPSTFIRFVPRPNSPIHPDNEPEIKEVISRPKTNIGY